MIPRHSPVALPLTPFAPNFTHSPTPRNMADEYSAAASINKIPVEILSNIFVVIYTLAHTSNTYDHSAVKHTILLSSVCTRWRQAAIATSALWPTSIEITGQGYLRKGLQYTNICLERSRNAPLHLRIGRHNFEYSLTSANEVLSTTLHSVSSRIKSVAIAYWHSSLAKEVLATLISQGSLGTLCELALCATSGDKLLYADTEVLSQESLSALLSVLKFLCLDSVSLNWNTAYLSCHNLVELQLIELPFNGFPTAICLAQLLAANRGLQSIKFSRFELHDYSYPSPGEQLAIALPELKNIKLYLNPKFISWFFRLPITIGTQGLSLHLSSYYVESEVAAVTESLNSFFQRTHVKALCISGYWLPFSFVYAALQYLEILRFSGQVFTMYTFAGMQEVPRFLPQLHTIDVVECIAKIDDIEPGFRSLLTVPSVRRIGIDGLSLYQSMDGDPSTERLMSIQSTRQWLEQGNVTAAISYSRLSNFYAFTLPFR